MNFSDLLIPVSISKKRLTTKKVLNGKTAAHLKALAEILLTILMPTKINLMMQR